MNQSVCYDFSSLTDAVLAAERAEIDLAISSLDGSLAERRATGSFYTPADVAEHFWREYLCFHGIATREQALRHLMEVQFVEPAVGAGMFLFSLLKQLTKLGCSPQDLSAVRFAAADINEAALAFVSRQVGHIEGRSSVRLGGLTLHQADFREFAVPQGVHVSFVGNPPYVREESKAKWRNLYATFLDRMISLPSKRVSISLILPLSIAFSRDYASLRERVRQWGQAIRLVNFDNIPDCLFKVGKPGSLNTNRANSQRCSVLFLRNHGVPSMEASELQRWSRKERARFLTAAPHYRDISEYGFDGQFPRPSCDWIMGYLRGAEEARQFRDLLGRGRHAFAVAPVARNFIGIREAASSDESYLLTFPDERRMLWALQILSSTVFYEYWRTVGDGFHVTRSDIERFPVTGRILRSCAEHEFHARARWAARDASARQKLNSGKEVFSFDFRGQFDYLAECVTAPNDPGDDTDFFPLPRRSMQKTLLGFTTT